MAVEFFDPGGLIVPAGSLGVHRAKALADALDSELIEFARLVECRVISSGLPSVEMVVVEVDVQRAQKQVHPINRTEVIAVQFTEGGGLPEVLALRKDFPYVPHLNLRDAEFPRSLCLYDQLWDDVKRSWSPSRFINQLRNWLAETSKGTLHQQDQPLEPLLLAGGYTIVLPHNLFKDANQTFAFLDVKLIGGEAGRVLVARKPSNTPKGLKFAAIPLRSPPQQHGHIRRTPANLHELHQMTQGAGLNLLTELREKFKSAGSNAEVLQSRLIVIIAFPKTRDGKDVVEATDTWAFLSLKSVAEIGEAIGCWTMDRGKPGYLLSIDASRTGQDVELEVVTTVHSLSRDGAALINGFMAGDTRRVLAIGAGALGSQVFYNLLRGGFGIWTILDKDHLLPHNVVRHALPTVTVGLEKAKALATYASPVFEDEPAPSAFHSNVLQPGESEDEIKKAIDSAQLILDMSASISVARHLAHGVDSPARRASLFLNQRGTDLVLLVEDEERKFPLDVIEMQYYRALPQQEHLQKHLEPPNQRVRYARSCRDVTSTIPQDFVAIHSGIGSRAIRNAVERKGAGIEIYHIDPADLTVRTTKVAPEPITKMTFGHWTLYIDEGLGKKLMAIRASKLPNETGGVLLGSVNLWEKIVYVVDALPSPPDSQEWPTVYIRGCQQLKEDVERVQKITGQNLEYIGEWHSHPEGVSPMPSSDDMKAFISLTKSMAEEGLPALMLIVADCGPTVHLGEMKQEGQ